MSIKLKLLITCALAIAPCSSEIIIPKQPIFTRTIKQIDQHSTTLAMNSHLLTISQNKSHVLLESTDINYASCVFAVSERLTDDRMRAAILGNKQKIVAWIVHYKHVFNETTLYASLTMLLIDPWHCDYKKIYLPNEYRLKWQIKNCLPGMQLEPQVITYRETFDVILGAYNTYGWCRFNDEGELIQRMNKLMFETLEYFDASYIRPVNFFAGINGYLYVYEFANSTANVKLLDHDFNVRMNIRIDKLFLISFLRNKYPTIVICYATFRPYGSYRSPYAYRCDRLNAHLDALSTVYLPLAVESALTDVSVTLDSLGNMFFTCCMENSTKLSLFHYDTDGRHVQTLNLDVSCDTQTFIQRPLILDGEYCFFDLKLLNDETSEFLRVINCIQVPATQSQHSKNNL